MKKYIIIIGLVLIAFNTIIGYLVSSYNSFNIVLTDINILLSVILCIFIAISKLESNYKITLAITFIITGMARIFASVSAEQSLKDNPVIIGIIIILGIEIIATVVAHSIKKSS